MNAVGWSMSESLMSSTKSFFGTDDLSTSVKDILADLLSWEHSN